MAINGFIEFGSSADIKGETNDATHKANGAVEVTSFTHTIRQPKSPAASSSGGHTAERTEHGEMIFTKDMDKASPKLFQSCSAGTIYPAVTIFFYRAVGGSNTTGTGANNRVCYLKVELKNVLVSSLTTSIEEGDIPNETFGLKYSSIRETYNQSKIDGSGIESTGNNIQGSWNLATNAVAF